MTLRFVQYFFFAASISIALVLKEWEWLRLHFCIGMRCSRLVLKIVCSWNIFCWWRLRWLAVSLFLFIRSRKFLLFIRSRKLLLLIRSGVFLVLIRTRRSRISRILLHLISRWFRDITLFLLPLIVRHLCLLFVLFYRALLSFFQVIP